MIELGRHPALGIVAAFAEGLSAAILELPAVRVLMARVTIPRRVLKLHLLRTDRGFVTGAALHGTVGAKERELCLRMVEAIDIDPRIGVVTRFAAEGRTAGALALHAVLKFAVVRIRMAGGASGV